MQFHWGEFKDNLVRLQFFLNFKHKILSPLTVEARLNPVLVVISCGVEVHVQETVVDPVVFHVEEVMVGVKVLSLVILEPLGVTKLVVEAVLEDESVEAGRGEAEPRAHAQLEDEEEKLLRHPVTVDVSVKS